MERAIKGLVTGRYALGAFTSTNASRQCARRLEEFGLDARAFAGLKIAAIGTRLRGGSSHSESPDLVHRRASQTREGLW